MVLKLVEDRIANKNGEYFVTPDFVAFLSESLNKENQQVTFKKSP